MNGEIYCLGCNGTLSRDVVDKESWRCPHCSVVEYDYGIRMTQRDIVCPKCGGMLEDKPNSKHLICEPCMIEWRV